MIAHWPLAAALALMPLFAADACPSDRWNESVPEDQAVSTSNPGDTAWPGRLPEEISSHPDEYISGPGFAVVADRRVFAVMAFMNAMGFDDEAKGQQMHPVRVKVREIIAAEMREHPREARSWKRRYEEWKAPSFIYQDLSLTLTPDYPFASVRPEAEMPYRRVARRMKGFVPLLNEFWRIVQLDRTWNAVKPEYMAEIRKFNLERMNAEMRFLWAYLRMERRDSLMVVSAPNLLDEHFSAIGARYGNAFFSVESPGAISYGLNIHEYLHSVVNPLVRASFQRFRPKFQTYYDAMKSSPAAKTYHDPVTYVFECVVRALDKRIDGRFRGISAEEQRRGELETVARSGLKLASDFHVLLANYETSDVPFDQYLPILLESLPEYRQDGASR